MKVKIIGMLLCVIGGCSVVDAGFYFRTDTTSCFQPIIDSQKELKIGGLRNLSIHVTDGGQRVQIKQCLKNICETVGKFTAQLRATDYYYQVSCSKDTKTCSATMVEPTAATSVCVPQ